MISVVQIKNPFQPSDGRISVELPFSPGMTVRDCLARANLYTAEGKLPGFIVSLNGHIVPGDFWEIREPSDGSFLVVTPQIAGGSTLRTLASIAVAAASIAVAAVSAGAGFALLGLSPAVTASVLSGAVAVAGNLLISAFMSTPSQKGSSPSYAFDGPSSLAQSGTVIPKGYGTFLSGGNIIASFVDVEGEDQYINCLICYGYGPARSITEIQINNKDISTYQNCQYYLRMGTNDQAPIPAFNQVVNGYPQDVQCLAGVPVVVPGTGDLTQILQVDIAFPDGVWVLTADNNLIPAVITYQVQYSVAGENNWQPVLQPQTTQDIILYNSDGTVSYSPAWVAVATDLPPNSGIVYQTDNGSHTAGDSYTASLTVEVFAANGNHYTTTKVCTGEWQPCNPELNQVQVDTWTEGYVDFVGCDRSPLYNRTSIYGLAAGKYDVQVIKYGSARLHDDVGFGDNNSPQIGQEVWIHSVNEISLLDLAYPNMILVGVRALATNQINGSNLSITALIQYGLRTRDNNILPSALQAYEEDNPACVAADMMLDGLYGGGQWPGITASNIDRYIDEWLDWAQLNDQLVDDGNGGSIRRHVFNGILDNESNLWDQLNVVGRMSRAQIIPLGRDYGVFVDQLDTPVQMFTMGNIIASSFTETWLDIDSRANQVEIQFADSTRYYRQDNPLVYMDPANQNAGVVIKNVRVDGKGITIPAQAWHLARYKERQNQYLLRSGSFKCDVDAIACRPGNLIILQHDVPQWGWGGRTLPNSTTTYVYLDRNDVPFAGGTSYSLIVLQPSVQRYAGTLTSVGPVIDGTGANLGTALGLSSFDNTQRVTRCVVTIPGTGGAAATTADCPITSSSAGSVTIAPIAGFTAAVGQAYVLYDTDVLESAAVSGVDYGVPGPGQGQAVVSLSAALSQAPQDFSTYFYGETGSQFIVRVASIRKSSDFRATIEWIDYNTLAYEDATPVIGETSAQSTSNPGVTSLLGAESVQLVAGSYIGYAQLSWRLGPDTVGVGIYGFIVGGNNSQPGGLPQLLARLTNYPTSWQMQIDAGNEWTFIVVGFDINGDYAAFASAPTCTIEFDGVAVNLLLGSNFTSGFTYWNLTPRAGDSLVPTLADDGQATYTVAGSTLATAMSLLNQIVAPSKWAVGEYLMLSAYFEDSCAVSTAPNVGELIATLLFINSSGALISSFSADVALNGVTPTLTRCNTASVQIPAGTTSVQVGIGVGGSGLSIPVGSVLTFSHLLLEVSEAGQTVPSEWADIDVQGQVLDIFQSGSSTALRVQGSVLPTFTGGFSYASTNNSVTISWEDLVIVWPDGASTFIQNASLEVTGLSASTSYYAFLSFDIINGGVHAQPPTTPLGTPAVLSAAYDINADAACNSDGRVQLTKGGYEVATVATGSGSSPAPTPPIPPTGGHPITEG
jgi:sulfur carrier protein ThiS